MSKGQLWDPCSLWTQAPAERPLYPKFSFLEGLLLLSLLDQFHQSLGGLHFQNIWWLWAGDLSEEFAEVAGTSLGVTAVRTALDDVGPQTHALAAIAGRFLRDVFGRGTQETKC